MSWTVSVRHRTRAVLMVLGLSFAAGTARSEAATFTLRPELGVQAGSETYELSASVPSPMTGVSASASSKLTYPTATVLAGGTLRSDFGLVSLSASALTNLIDPWGNMVDQDFVAVSAGTQSQQIEFSHTDSRTTLRALDLEAAARFRVAELGREPGPPALHLVAGFRFESSNYDAYGAWGWQLDSNATKVPVSLPGDPLALHYEVRYWVPFVGAGVTLGTGRRFVLGAEARVAPSWSTHDDDHILRHKVGHASAHGVALALAAEPGVDLGAGRGVQIILGLSGQLQYIASSARLKQHFYADDPTLPGNQLGEPIPDGDFSAASFRARLLAFLSVRF